MNLVYISNTRIPSEKANSYQSMVMCEAFSKYFNKVEFWYPDGRTTKEMEKIDDAFDFYQVERLFELKKVSCLDSDIFFGRISSIWFLLKNISFAFNYIKELKKIKDETIIFSRDVIGLYFLNFAKRINLIKQNVYFEAHIYSKKISNSCKNIDGLIVINNYLKTLYEKDGIKNILVAHDGVNIDEYSNMAYKEKQNYFNIVYTGNLFKWKGVYTLADSMKYLENMKCTIVGGSNDTLPQFKQHIKDNNIKNIYLTGFIKKSETIKYVEQADILILPNSSRDKMSYYTSPLKLFEYMASKKPIVASNLPSICEVLENKKNAVLCEPDNPKDLADKINWVLENDCTDIVNQAYVDVQEYTWDKRAKNIKDFMEKL
ncbi:glycosyltransferase family 4 protein [Aliarcobacter butzleri]|uniref:glycosyltransferase family 4 protein n=1 Tax=Aliarcobacter butzleri TaxID=28197 RepID=UPI001EDC97BB|nr:glycosyltransferase [Aliarcobacter butzleri]MCG3697534.1 glycosyltransferase [Aliarcobacter butzleri]MCG3698946.1 glycosyltransferase [Aliarcobacter butzleri]MCT7619671.1 glycosyltransferase [Aliarcobacter butzleri]MDN5091637.1 glycosyltransferase [Aliarcobacter butzleri]